MVYKNENKKNYKNIKKTQEQTGYLADRLRR